MDRHQIVPSIIASKHRRYAACYILANYLNPLQSPQYPSIMLETMTDKGRLK